MLALTLREVIWEYGCLPPSCQILGSVALSSNYWLLSLPSVCSRAAPLLHSPQAIEYVTSAMGLGAQGHCAP
ncbi:Bilin biosynthesis protein CpeZ [Dissostichus eleginoides]|uniref:Bilin biosynthesis protein CpeZ n=1 Tax=Dissostichus eleginoides TaxID=100907 RepID=A0AAD9BT09_DISEL|nr:Bilin biosynthesis protein CpeZ [Dissostichus eleginoides]